MKLRFVAALGAVLMMGPVMAADELEDATQGLKDAVARKDPAQVKKLATDAYAMADKIIKSPAPASEVEKDDWNRRVAAAKELDLFADYSLYATAVQAQPAETVDLLSTLEQLSPKSKYMDEGYERYLYALHQTGADAKVTAIAEKGIQNFPNNPDLLLVLADAALTKKQPDKALGYGRRLVANLMKHPKPEDMSAADWDKKRDAALGHGYWTVGVVTGEKGLYAESNKNLRAALPLIKGSEAMTAAALFYLGVDNYQLGTMTNNKAQVLEGAKFSQQAAAISGPYAQQAYHNSLSMKDAADRMR